MFYAFSDVLDFSDLVGEYLGCELDLDFHRIEVARAVDDYLIVRADDFFDVHEHGFNLRREDIDAADDEHIVRPAADALHSDEGAAAVGADLVIERAYIARAVADERHALLPERGENELPSRAVGDLFQGVGVHYLGIEEVLHDMEPPSPRRSSWTRPDR